MIQTTCLPSSTSQRATRLPGAVIHCVVSSGYNAYFLFFVIYNGNCWAEICRVHFYSEWLVIAVIIISRQTNTVVWHYWVEQAPWPSTTQAAADPLFIMVPGHCTIQTNVPQLSSSYSDISRRKEDRSWTFLWIRSIVTMSTVHPHDKPSNINIKLLQQQHTLLQQQHAQQVNDNKPHLRRLSEWSDRHISPPKNSAERPNDPCTNLLPTRASNCV